MNNLDIGHIIAVEGDSIEVHVTVFNLHREYHGKTYRVGRLGSYVTVPMDRRTLIGYVTRVGVRDPIEADPEPGTPPRMTMTCQLLGTVQGDKFSRGVNEYPTIGDPVRIGVDEDFELIFGCFDDMAGAKEGGERKSFSLGRFAIDTDFEVKVLGKEFFAKHVAVMGNSGSGKSVTTAKIVYEAMRLPHAQVVMFDMHGEYLKAFSDDFGNPLPNVTYLSDRNLVLPYWLMNFEEFEQLFIDSNNPLNLNAQKIFLRQAFERLKLAAAEELDMRWEYTIDTPVYYALEQLQIYAQNMNAARYVLNTPNYAFSRLPFRQLPPVEQEKLLLTKKMEFNPATSEGEVPHATFFGNLLGFINQIETKLNDRRYDFLLRPFDQARRNADLARAFDPTATPGKLSKSVTWVIRQLLGQLDERKNLTIVDLSGLPFDVVDTTVAVLTRALFDFNFWSPPDLRQPVLIVFEEAHNYLPRKPIPGRKTFARNAVEKVAKEGRKYGVSAMIVSQRPSEISETVLSQCNSMVLMRMNNPDDQEYAARVVSDQFRSLISLLPSLKPGEGFIIGDAVLMPMRTLIDMPPKEPQSANMDFFKLWTIGGRGGDPDRIVDRWWRQERTGAQIANNSKPPQQPTIEEPKQNPFAATADGPASSTPGSLVKPGERLIGEFEATEQALRPHSIEPDEPAEPEARPWPYSSPITGEQVEGGEPAAAPTTAQRKLAELAARFGLASNKK